MAARFQFGLERVRDLRAHTEEQAKEQFAASLSHRAHGEAMLRAAEHQLAEARSGHRAGMPDSSLTATDLLAHQAYVERLERSRRDAVVELEQREQDLADSRARLERASQDREVLDQLRERQRMAHLHEVERAERAEIDDIAIQNHIRRKAA
ncbi:MAG: flagellar export protein FliJ [Baekduia sp.]